MFAEILLTETSLEKPAAELGDPVQEGFQRRQFCVPVHAYKSVLGQ